jgi:GntR family transcriptional regulator/MocR family aminotransferase
VKASIEKHFGEVVVSGDAGGTHMLWTLPDQCPPAAEFQQIARAAGVGVHPLRSGPVLYEDALSGFERRVVLGYVHLAPAQIDDGFARAADALSKTRASRYS